jgi:galactokinase/mevalonate kinase-like predicted kinase
MISASAPGRCGIVGNPSDMYGGSVISVSTIERARCVLEPSDALYAASSGQDAVFASAGDLALQGDNLDVVRAALGFLRIDPSAAGFSVNLTTEIPVQAGLAGSTALLVALVGALNQHFDWRLHPWAVAETARKVEARTMGIVCGLQDQHMAVFGGLNYMDFAGKELLEQRDDEPLATVEPLAPFAPEVPLLAAHTGIRHHSGTVHRSPRERWLAGEPLVRDAYRRIAEIARLGKRPLLAADWPALGALMDENHAIVSRLGGSGPANDRLIEAARAAGAYGAKLAGAGGGGTVLVLTDRPDLMRAALLEAGADSIMVPAPSPGLTVEEVTNDQ